MIPIYLIIFVKFQNWMFRRFWRAKRQIEKEDPSVDSKWWNR